MSLKNWLLDWKYHLWDCHWLEKLVIGLEISFVGLSLVGVHHFQFQNVRRHAANKVLVPAAPVMPSSRRCSPPSIVSSWLVASRDSHSMYLEYLLLLLEYP
jgi:hypothetical protein